eukprot:gnl/TRDRNA2_/TRDRNA2_173838_c3_seq2.p1 gnl/TRDRNA2_/TRDRNA2_173838_c3~~gnl/TRDRNA2_/TRDRNA2_173838_c3_seq2.p1  ORF type:complete len:132 (+),score=25.69 gnl/TRDRNA2_/TRDRNA2_173838_c3_seq2:479-874(+)
MSWSDESLFVALARAATQRVWYHLDDFSAQGLANAAWAFAVVAHADGKLFVALAWGAARRVSEFQAQGLAGIPWALRKVSQSGGKLFGLLAAAAKRHVNEWSAQKLANIAWVFSQVCAAVEGTGTTRERFQ